MPGMVEIATICFLVILTGVAVWWFAVAEMYNRYLRTTSITRGLTGESGDIIKLSCPEGRVISVDTATQICTNPNARGFEDSTTDPMDVGTDAGHYGDFSPKTTLTLTDEIGKEANNRQSHVYAFRPLNTYTADDGVSSVQCGGTIQLVGTYTCKPT